MHVCVGSHDTKEQKYGTVSERDKPVASGCEGSLKYVAREKMHSMDRKSSCMCRLALIAVKRSL